jgi:hypothetical protein
MDLPRKNIGRRYVTLVSQLLADSQLLGEIETHGVDELPTQEELQSRRQRVAYLVVEAGQAFGDFVRAVEY